MDAFPLLLQPGVNPNLCNFGGKSPLQAVASQGIDRIATLQLLIDRGADVNGGESSRASALGAAVSAKPSLGAEPNSKVVKFLVCHGANPNPWGPDSPLHCAVQGRDLDSIQELLDAGADPEREHLATGSPIDYAVFLRYDDIAQILQEASILVHENYNLARGYASAPERRDPWWGVTKSAVVSDQQELRSRVHQQYYGGTPAIVQYNAMDMGDLKRLQIDRLLEERGTECIGRFHFRLAYMALDHNELDINLSVATSMNVIIRKQYKQELYNPSMEPESHEPFTSYEAWEVWPEDKSWRRTKMSQLAFGDVLLEAMERQRRQSRGISHPKEYWDPELDGLRRAHVDRLIADRTNHYPKNHVEYMLDCLLYTGVNEHPHLPDVQYPAGLQYIRVVLRREIRRDITFDYTMNFDESGFDGGSVPKMVDLSAFDGPGESTTDDAVVPEIQESQHVSGFLKKSPTGGRANKWV